MRTLSPVERPDGEFDEIVCQNEDIARTLSQERQVAETEYGAEWISAEPQEGLGRATNPSATSNVQTTNIGRSPDWRSSGSSWIPARGSLDPIAREDSTVGIESVRYGSRVRVRIHSVARAV